MKKTNRIFSLVMGVLVIAFLASCQQFVNTPNGGSKVLPLDVSNWGGDGNAGTDDLVTLTGTGGTVTGGSFTVTGATYEDQSATTLIPSGEGKTEIEVAVDANGHMTSTANAVDWVSVTGGSDNNGGGPVTWTVNTDTLTSGAYGFRAHFINSGGRNGGDYKENKTGGEDVTVNLCQTYCSGTVYGVMPNSAVDINPWSGSGNAHWSSTEPSTDCGAQWIDGTTWTKKISGGKVVPNLAFNLNEWSYTNTSCAGYVNTVVSGGYTGTLYAMINGGTTNGTWFLVSRVLDISNNFLYYQINNQNDIKLTATGNYTVTYATANDGTGILGTFAIDVTN